MNGPPSSGHVVIVGGHHCHALRGTAHSRDRLHGGAQELATLGNQHQLLNAIHLSQGDDQARPVSHLVGDHALARAALLRVFGLRRALAEAARRHGQELCPIANRLESDQRVAARLPWRGQRVAARPAPRIALCAPTTLLVGCSGALVSEALVAFPEAPDGGCAFSSTVINQSIYISSHCEKIYRYIMYPNRVEKMNYARSAMHFGVLILNLSFFSPSSSPDYNHFLRRGYDRGDTSVVYR